MGLLAALTACGGATNDEPRGADGIVVGSENRPPPGSKTGPVEGAVGYGQDRSVVVERTTSAMTQDAQFLYLFADGAIVRVEKTMLRAEEIATGDAIEALTSDVAVDDSHLYWPKIGDAANQGAIVRVDKSGGEPEFVAKGLARPVSIAVDANYVYWLEEDTLDFDGAGSVKRMPKGGGQREVLASPKKPKWIAVEGDDVFYGEDDRAIRRIRPGVGAVPTTIADNRDGIARMVGDGAGGVVWTEGRASSRGGVYAWSESAGVTTIARDAVVGGVARWQAKTDFVTTKQEYAQTALTLVEHSPSGAQPLYRQVSQDGIGATMAGMIVVLADASRVYWVDTVVANGPWRSVVHSMPH